MIGWILLAVVILALLLWLGGWDTIGELLEELADADWDD